MTTREQAIQWWDNLDLGVPHLLSQTYYKGRATSSLTGSEIEEIWQKETQTDENIYLNRLKEQYKIVKTREANNQETTVSYFQYKGMRLFCLDTQLVSFNDIEAMEYEVNQSF